MLARKPLAAVPAFDLAMRTPKSVSILHALAHLVPPETLTAMGLPANLAAEVVAAHRATVDAIPTLVQCLDEISCRLTIYVEEIRQNRYQAAELAEVRRQPSSTLDDHRTW